MGHKERSITYSLDWISVAVAGWREAAAAAADAATRSRMTRLADQLEATGPAAFTEDGERLVADFTADTRIGRRRAVRPSVAKRAQAPDKRA